MDAKSPEKKLTSHPPDVEAGTTTVPSRGHVEADAASSSMSIRGGKRDLLAQEHTDPVLGAKMGLVNDVCFLFFLYC